jgi:hypothetical protein
MVLQNPRTRAGGPAKPSGVRQVCNDRGIGPTTRRVARDFQLNRIKPAVPGPQVGEEPRGPRWTPTRSSQFARFTRCHSGSDTGIPSCRSLNELHTNAVHIEGCDVSVSSANVHASAITACTRCTRSGSRNTLRGLRSCCTSSIFLCTAGSDAASVLRARPNFSMRSKSGGRCP